MRLKRFISFFLYSLEDAKWFIVIAMVFRGLLDLVYLLFINPVFSYSGFFLDVCLLKYIESWLVLVLLVAMFPKKLSKPSDFLMTFIFFSLLVPLLAFYALSNASRDGLYVVLVSMVLIVVFRSGKPFFIPLFTAGPIIAYSILSIGIFAVTVLMIKSGGLAFFNLNLMRVYEFRSDVGEVINRGVMGYLNVWAQKVFGPIVLAVALWKKKYSLALAVFGLHVLWFGISSQKSVLFYPLVIFFLWFGFQRSRALALVPLGMSILILMGFLSYLFFSDIILGSLFIRRVFFLPSLLAFAYYDFFSQNQLVYWSNSITSSFIQYPYNLKPPELICSYALGKECHANVSFLSTGYMHAGILGTIIYGILVGLIFRCIDSLANKGIPPWLAVASVIVPTLALVTSSDLPTALLTHGLGVAIIILFLLRSARDLPKLRNKNIFINFLKLSCVARP